jgi:hypothetical protein
MNPIERGVSECDRETSIMRRPWPITAPCKKKKRDQMPYSYYLHSHEYEKQQYGKNYIMGCIICTHYYYYYYYYISFMQGIYTYIPETNHVPKEYNVAAILSLILWRPYH